MRTFHVFAFCGLVTIFLLSLSITTAEDEIQHEEDIPAETRHTDEEVYDDDEIENGRQDQVIDPRPCPRNQVFGRAACERICKYDEEQSPDELASARPSFDSIWSKPTTCRQSDEFDETFCSCPNDKDGGLDLTICRAAEGDDENKEAGLNNEELSHCHSLCSLEDKIAYSCQIRVEEETVPVCACGGRVDLQFLESRERKKKWATMVREKRAGKGQTDSSPPVRADVETYLNLCVNITERLDKNITILTDALQNISDTLTKYSKELKKTE